MTNDHHVMEGSDSTLIEDVDDDLLSQIRELLAEAIAAISNESLRRRMRLRFGVDDGKSLTLAAVGQLEGVSRERIRQNEQQFLRRFGRAAKREGTPQFLLRQRLREFVGLRSLEDEADVLVERLSMSPSPADQVFPGASPGRATVWFFVFSGLKWKRTLAAQINAAIRVRRVERRRTDAAGRRLARLLEGALWAKEGTPSRGRVTPVRQVNNLEGQEPPVIVSRKTGRPVAFESNLEKQMIETLEDAATVEWYVEQPVTIRYAFRGNSRRYVPDFLVHLQDGRVLLIEVKSLVDTPLVLNLAKFNAALDYCARLGWGFVVAEASRGPHIPILCHYRDLGFEKSLTRRLERGPLSFVEYRNLFPNTKFAALAAAAVALGLEFERPFRLSGATIVGSFSSRATEQMDSVMSSTH